MSDLDGLQQHLSNKLTALGFQVAAMDGEQDTKNLIAQREDYVDDLFRIVMITLQDGGRFHIKIDTKQGRSKLKAMARSGYTVLKTFVEQLFAGTGCYVTGYRDIQRNTLRPNIDVIPDPAATIRIEFYGSYGSA